MSLIEVFLFFDRRLAEVFRSGQDRLFGRHEKRNLPVDVEERFKLPWGRRAGGVRDEDRVGGIYFVLFVAAVWLGGTKNRFRFPEAGPDRLARYGTDLILALVAAAIVIFATRVLTRRVSAFREMARLFREILGPLNREEIFLVSAFSAVAEEFFFRGFLQAVIGFVPTSVFFGLLHVGPGRKFIPWTLFAVTLGFALGGLYAWRENLLAPVVMHFAINFGNLLAIQRPVPDPDQGAGSS